MSKEFMPLVLLGIACVPVMLFAFAYWMQNRRRAKSLRARLDQLDQHIGSFEERLLTIETHALDYLNSLTVDGNKALYETKELVAAGKNLADEIQELIETGDVAAYGEAERLLRDQFPLTEEMVRKFDGSYVRRYPKYRNWKDVIENNLQQVGREVSRASNRATESGIPKRKKRQSTVVSLMQAGVRAATQGVRMQQAPVRTLLRKNNSLKVQ